MDGKQNGNVDSGRSIGTLYCVSTGPGEPELMTLKAVRIARECPVIALSVDGTRRDREHLATGDQAALRAGCVAYSIAAPVVPGLDEKEFLYLSMPMSHDKRLVAESHEEAARMVIQVLEQGRSVAWLTLGDATVYASSAYVAAMVESVGFPVEFVSGVPSFCAAAAALGRPLVKGSEQLHIIPSSYNIEEALSLPGTKVLMKAGSRMGQVKVYLEENGYKAQGVQRCGMEGQRIYRATEQLEEEAGYYTVLLVD